MNNPTQKRVVPLGDSARNGDLEGVKRWVGSGGNINEQAKYQRTAIAATIDGCYEAAYKNRAVTGSYSETLDFLLAQPGRNLEVQDVDNRTALMLGVSFAHTSPILTNMTLKLINAGADVSVLDGRKGAHPNLGYTTYGQTMPAIAVRNNAFTVLDALLAKSTLDLVASTAIVAAEKSNVVSLAYCVKHGYDLNKLADTYKEFKVQAKYLAPLL